MKLENFFSPDQVILVSEAEEKQKVIKKMINGLKNWDRFKTAFDIHSGYPS
jgi:mannitol/fructose-specific phosphotransferase system IIA component (Ntr-type)